MDEVDRFGTFKLIDTTLITRDVPIPHFKPIPILLPIPPFRANTDTADTTNTFLSIEHHQ